MLKIKDIFKSKKVRDLETRIFLLETEKMQKENECATLRDILKNSNCSSLLLEENKTLIKWIHDILEQFGTMDVYDRNRFCIPVYRKLGSDYFSKDYGIQRIKVETIVIPEIVIHNMK